MLKCVSLTACKCIDVNERGALRRRWFSAQVFATQRHHHVNPPDACAPYNITFSLERNCLKFAFFTCFYTGFIACKSELQLHKTNAISTTICKQIKHLQSGISDVNIQSNAHFINVNIIETQQTYCMTCDISIITEYIIGALE